MDVTTPVEVFTEIDTRLKADPTKIGSLNAAYSFDLEGEEYHIVLKDGAGEAGTGAAENPNITLTMKPDDFVGIATGTLDPTTAFMAGKIKVKGDMGLAMKLQSVLRG